MKRNDIIFFEDELFIVVRELHCNVLYDPTPHMGIEVRKPLTNEIARIILDDDYSRLSVIAMS